MSKQSKWLAVKHLNKCHFYCFMLTSRIMVLYWVEFESAAMGIVSRYSPMGALKITISIGGEHKIRPGWSLFRHIFRQRQPI
jgi:hypothetical protein